MHTSGSTQLLQFTLACVMVVANGSTAWADEQPWHKLIESGRLSKHWETTGNWRAENETIKLVPRKGEHGWQRYDAYLWYYTQVGDFEIDFEYKVETKGNSGFYFRVGDKGNPVHTGIEVQIYDSASRGAGHRLNDHDAGGIIPFRIPPKASAAKPAGQWNRFQIAVRKDKLTVKLNGKLVNEVALAGAFKSRPAKGWIGFQDHGMPLELKNVKIRTL